MCIMKLEDTESSIDVVLFPKTWQEMKDIVETGKAFVVEGRLDDRGQFLPDKIVPAEGAELRAQKYARIVLNVEMHKELDMKKFVIALHRCKGKARLLIELHDKDDSMLVCLANNYCVDPSKLPEAVAELLPEGMYEIFAA